MCRHAVGGGPIAAHLLLLRACLCALLPAFLPACLLACLPTCLLACPPICPPAFHPHDTTLPAAYLLQSALPFAWPAACMCIHTVPLQNHQMVPGFPLPASTGNELEAGDWSFPGDCPSSSNIILVTALQHCEYQPKGTCQPWDDGPVPANETSYGSNA